LIGYSFFLPLGFLLSILSTTFPRYRMVKNVVAELNAEVIQVEIINVQLSSNLKTLAV